MRNLKLETFPARFAEVPEQFRHFLGSPPSPWPLASSPLAQQAYVGTLRSSTTCFREVSIGLPAVSGDISIFLFQLVFLFSISRFFGTCVFVPTSGPAKICSYTKVGMSSFLEIQRSWNVFRVGRVSPVGTFPQVLGPGFASSSWSRRPWQRCLFFYIFLLLQVEPGWFGFDGRFSRIYTQNVIKAVKLGSSFGGHMFFLENDTDE